MSKEVIIQNPQHLIVAVPESTWEEIKQYQAGRGLCDMFQFNGRYIGILSETPKGPQNLYIRLAVTSPWSRTVAINDDWILVSYLKFNEMSFPDKSVSDLPNILNPEVVQPKMPMFNDSNVTNG